MFNHRSIRAIVFSSLLTFSFTSQAFVPITQFLSCKDDKGKTIPCPEEQPGMAFAFYQKNKPLIDGLYGYSDLEQRIPLSEQTFFRTGSVSKVLLSLAVLKLMNKYNLSLNTSFNGLAKEFKGVQEIKTVGANKGMVDEVTVAQLLTHTSGPVSYTHLTLPTRFSV